MILGSKLKLVGNYYNITVVNDSGSNLKLAGNTSNITVVNDSGE